MTKAEFLTALSAAAKNPAINHPRIELTGAIRLGPDEWNAIETRRFYCPITAVAKQRGVGDFNTHEFFTATRKLGGLDDVHASDVVTAADHLYFSDPILYALRRELLHAVGLDTEQEPTNAQEVP